jgi:hypothetical protein
MDSSAEDRLAVLLRLYESARDRQDQDMADATSDAQADAIQSNLDALKLNYLKAERERLEASGAAVEAAYQSAKAAADNVDRAYRRGAALAERIRTVAVAVTAASSLLAKAAVLA